MDDMKKRGFLAIAAVTMALSMLSASAAFAGNWGQTGGKWFYYEDNGTVAKSTWVTSEGGTFWVNSDGAMAANQWVNDGDDWYYVDANGLSIRSQLTKLDSKSYWFGEDGKMLKNDWKQMEDGKWYYFGDDGVALTKGWHMIDGDYYYFLNSGVLATDALVPGGYRVGADGKWVQ